MLFHLVFELRIQEIYELLRELTIHQVNILGDTWTIIVVLIAMWRLSFLLIEILSLLIPLIFIWLIFIHRYLLSFYILTNMHSLTSKISLTFLFEGISIIYIAVINILFVIYRIFWIILLVLIGIQSIVITTTTYIIVTIVDIILFVYILLLLLDVC